MKLRFSRLFVLLFVALASSSFAVGGYLYSLNYSGVISVNANRFNTYKSYYNPDNPSVSSWGAWRDMAIVGDSQYAIRGDGLLLLNGANKWQLPASNDGWIWNKIQYSRDTVYCLRTDGALSSNNVVVKTLPQKNFYFPSLEATGATTYSLRSDGSVFEDIDKDPIFVFNAGKGLFGYDDGKEEDTLWVCLRLDPTGRYLYALRTDGKLYRGDLDSSNTEGALVATLPFPTNYTEYAYGELYYDFEYDRISTNWAALRINGQVYLSSNPQENSDDFPGLGETNDDCFWDLAFHEGRYFALRADGNVYVQGSTNTYVKLPDSSYGTIRFGLLPPNLEEQSDFPPSVVQYTITVNTNQPVRVPVIATDSETPSANLIVTPVEVPVGAIWNEAARELTWTAPAAKGKYIFSCNVTDEQGNTTTVKNDIKVKYPDLNLSKNKSPYVPKIKNGMALSGREYRLYIPLTDPDNEPVTVSYDSSSYPFNAGATYDSATSEFVWKPANPDIGKWTISLTLSDGVKSKKLKIKLQVASPVVIEPLPPLDD